MLLKKRFKRNWIIGEWKKFKFATMTGTAANDKEVAFDIDNIGRTGWASRIKRGMYSTSCWLHND